MQKKTTSEQPEAQRRRAQLSIGPGANEVGRQGDHQKALHGAVRRTRKSVWCQLVKGMFGWSKRKAIHRFWSMFPLANKVF